MYQFVFHFITHYFITIIYFIISKILQRIILESSGKDIIQSFKLLKKGIWRYSLDNDIKKIPLYLKFDIITLCVSYSCRDFY